MSQESVAVVRTFHERSNAEDLDPAFELLAPNVPWHTAPGSVGAGKTIRLRGFMRHREALEPAGLRE